MDNDRGRLYFPKMATVMYLGPLAHQEVESILPP